MRQKLYIPVRGESLQDGNPSPPPPPPSLLSGGSKVAGPYMGTRQNDPPVPANTRQDPPTYHVTRGGGKRGWPATFQNAKISFLRAVRRETVSYIVTRAYKRPAKTTRLSQSATLHSTGNISAEASENKNKAGHNSTRGTVRSLLFFCWKYCRT